MPSPDTGRQYWFAAKRYGWGWGLPITWQGWVVLVLLLWLAVVFSVTRYLMPHGLVFHLAFVLVMVLVLVGICYKKGEPPRWRWGDED